MATCRIAILSVLFVLEFSDTAHCQNLLPNSGFEDGTDKPAGWRLEGGSGGWVETAKQGKRALMVEGKGSDSAIWRADRLKLQPGGLYRLSFQARKESGASGGCGVAGTSRVNHDFHFSESWQRYSFVFTVPDDESDDYLRLGHWETKGRVLFDEAELLPVQARHAHPPIGDMGEGESVRDGVYRFQAHYGWEGANYHRTLVLNRTGFNSDRWVFSQGSALVYRLNAGAQEQRNAKLTVQVNYHTGGNLRVEASRTQGNWTQLGVFGKEKRGGTLDLPAALFPAKEIFVRLVGEGSSCGLQVNTFNYEAPLAGSHTDAEGRTFFLDEIENTSQFTVSLRAILPRSGGLVTCQLDVSNQTQATIETKVKLEGLLQRSNEFDRMTIAPKQAGFCCPGAVIATPGRHSLGIRLVDSAGNTVFLGRTEVQLGFLDDPRVGHWLNGTERISVRWCESGWKTSRYGNPGKRPPDGPAGPVTVSVARGEYEAAQVILSPEAPRVLQAVETGPLRNRQGTEAPITVQICEVVYARVSHPSDDSAERDWYPDPLPPLKTPLALRDGENMGLWLTFHVPRDAQAGDYTGEMLLKFDGGEALRVPLAAHVYDFELPHETHLRSALGLGTHEINRYHKLTKLEDKQTVYEKYLQNFAEHRITPYSFFDYAPIDIQFTGQGTNKQAKVDFTKFDRAAAKWLDQEKLNGFLLPLRGMGGGTFHSRYLGELEGFKEGTPEFARLFGDYLGQIQQHLKQRGWLDKAYTYWFDEPDPKDYQFVVDGMKRIKAAAPGLKRMLTEQPEPELQGHVEIWCGLTPEWTREKVAARRAAGEEVWWYLCTGPKAPYVTIFIDHPGTEMRLWPWQSWQYGVQGILVWSTTYWTSGAAFPGKLQDPWADPMGYVSGYDFKPGHIGYWGNGDGRFLYPPRRDPNTATEPILDGPVSSIRWENLRDGMEDYEYFWLLEREVKRVEALKGETLKRDLDEARRLLLVPDEISKDLTHFTSDPRPMLEHRDRVARMIEKLRQIR